MKFASYIKDGQPTFGAAVDGGLATLGGRIAGIHTLKAAITAGKLGELAAAAEGAKADAALDKVTLLPIIPDPGKILCIGKNYLDHAAESGDGASETPGFFIRVNDSVVAHGDAIERPQASVKYDYEGELALVIGKGGRHIAEKDALSHVAGYTCFMDGSLRDFQKRCIAAGKNFHRSGAAGPWLVTADEIGDPARLTLTTFLNDQQVQKSGVDMLIHSVPRCISYLSEIFALAPGDVIATGTPAGVGYARNPPLWMKPGDNIRVEISGIGTLSNRVVAEA